MSHGAVRALPLAEFKRILFATDFSPCSRIALSYARAIAARYGSTVYVMHVIPCESATTLPLDDRLHERPDDRLCAAERSMGQFLAGDPLHGIAYDALLERGDICEVLAGLVQQLDVDLIVVGTHGREGIRRLVLGSVAERIFRRAPCPVLTVGPGVRGGGIAAGELATVLCATDFSSGSLHALYSAISLVQRANARLLLLHAVQHATGTLADTTKSMRQRLESLLPAETVASCRGDFIVRLQPPTDAILDTAADQNADLIVMGAHRWPKAGVAPHLPWSTGYRVICHAPCPVLTVRARDVR